MKKRLASFLAIALIMMTFSGCVQTGTANTDQTAIASNIQNSIENSTITGETGSTTLADYSAAQVISLSEEKSVTINSGGYYSVSGTLANGQIIIDTTEKVFLELAGVAITNKSGPALQITNAKKTTLTLKSGSTNTLTDGGSSEFNAALFSNDTLIIEGEGKLIITGNNEHGIESDDDVIINGGEITISAKNDGIHANDNITVNGGKVNIKNAVEGLESKGDIIVNNGLLTLSCSDDAINAAVDLTINGGNIYAKSSRGDALDSNGTINIKGGTIVAIGANQPECGIDNDRINLSISGGTLVAIGGSNSMPTAAISTQCSLSLGGLADNSLIHIEGEDGDVLTFAGGQNWQSMLFSSPLLKQGKTYTVYTGGKVSGGTEFYGLYSGASYSEGVKGDSFSLSSVVTNQGGDNGGIGGMGRGGMPPNGGREGNMNRPPR